MTIPAGPSNSSDRWCDTCQEVCRDHGRMCTICGSTLVTATAAASVRNSSSNSSSATRATLGTTTAARIRLVPDSLLDETRQASRELRDLLRRHSPAQTSARGEPHIPLGTAAGFAGLLLQQQQQADVDGIPAAWLDPQGGGSTTSSRATSQQVLSSIPRITLSADSSLFYQAKLTVSSRGSSSSSAIKTDIKNDNDVTVLAMEAIPAEFGISSSKAATTTATATAPNSVSLTNAALVIADPITGKNVSQLSDACIQRIQQYNSNVQQQQQRPVLVYLQRGDDVTFVQKALLAQRAGAAACIIGNDRHEPWPFVMRDTKQEANKPGNLLSIPVVMISRKDSVALLEAAANGDANFILYCLEIAKHQQHDRECPVCADAFAVGHTVVRLPVCRHVFHESCAMTWLSKHNTCPYCRYELPLQDEDYERQRRQQQSSSSATSGSGIGSDAFYG